MEAPERIRISGGIRAIEGRCERDFKHGSIWPIDCQVLVRVPVSTRWALLRGRVSRGGRGPFGFKPSRFGQKTKGLLVTIREGTTLPVSREPGCNLWVSVGWYPPVWLGRAG